jgi:oxalate decarboxylase
LGVSEINNYEPGELWYFAKGHGHFILSFDNSILGARHVLNHRLDQCGAEGHAASFILPKDFFDVFPKAVDLHPIGANPARLAGGTFQLASIDALPASKTMSDGLMVIRRGK